MCRDRRSHLLSAQKLGELFCQPFDALPTACEMVDEKVRQVRICIEVLRAYAAAEKITLPASFADKEARYRSDTYQSLLLKLGTVPIQTCARAGGHHRTIARL